MQLCANGTGHQEEKWICSHASHQMMGGASQNPFQLVHTQSDLSIIPSHQDPIVIVIL